jgi:3-phenylpropionate/trans-cinnamate dioxygenase ferredoxin subunit
MGTLNVIDAQKRRDQGATMSDYIRAAALDQIPPGKSRLAFVAGKTVALFNIGGEIFALNDSCPHAGSSLAMGKLEGAVVQCRAHGLRFDVRTGHMPGRTDGLRAASLPVRVTGNEVQVCLDAPACAGSSGCTKQTQSTTNGDGQHSCAG